MNWRTALCVFRRCAAADLFVSTSHGEGLPVAVMEVMAAGCPVVLVSVGSRRDETIVRQSELLKGWGLVV